MTLMNTKSSSKMKSSRHLTQNLIEQGEQPLYMGNGEVVTCQEALAKRIWDLISTGQITLTADRTLYMESASEWVRAVKWLYEHIDGGIKPRDENIGGEQNLIVNVIEKRMRLPEERDHPDTDLRW